jgi:hypothetical protein
MIDEPSQKSIPRARTAWASFLPKLRAGCKTQRNSNNVISGVHSSNCRNAKLGEVREQYQNPHSWKVDAKSRVDLASIRPA